MLKSHWYTVKKQSLAIYARDAGFDLAMYDTYEKKIQSELRKRAVQQALAAIRLACSNQDFDVSTITTGVYVIALSNPLSINYRYKRSQVIYIGRGNIISRIKSHFDRKLFDFMLSLSGADFDFYFAKPARSGTANYFKHVEHLMLDYFTYQYGGIDERRKFPILNKNAGNNQNFSEGTDWWMKPLKAIGHRPLWALSPTNFGDFPPLDE